MTPLLAAALLMAWAVLAVSVALAIGAMAAARDEQVPACTRPAPRPRAVSPALGVDRPSR
jgi:hypothetical protein